MRGGTLLIRGHMVKGQGQLCHPARGCHALRCLVFFFSRLETNADRLGLSFVEKFLTSSLNLLRLTKLDRKLELNVLYHACVFRATKIWTPWPLIGEDKLIFSSVTTERNLTKVDWKKIIQHYLSLCFRTDRKTNACC